MVGCAIDKFVGNTAVKLSGAAKGRGATGAMPPLAIENKKKHISKDRMKIKENLKTCALKKVYIKKEHDKKYFFILM